MTVDSASARLTVDLDALAANHATLAAEAAGAEVAPVVKADGYGLGAAAVAARLHAEGARSFFVARVAEGEALRRALGPTRSATVYVLDGAPPDSTARLLAADLTPVLSSPAQLELWKGLPGPPSAAVHVDTGMNRLGLAPEEAESLARSPGFDVTLVMSHLACAGEPAHPLNARQLAAFRGVRALFPGALASLASSAGIFLGPEYRFDVVRPGISLYGGGPFDRPDPRIGAVATLEAPVLQVRTVAAGDTVGYGATFTAARAMQVAVVAAGYADGFLRAGGARGVAAIDGVPCPVVGRVSMDLIALDVSGVPGLRPGRLVQLLGPEVPLDEVAARADTLAYELLVRLGPRAERRYLGAPG